MRVTILLLGFLLLPLMSPAVAQDQRDGEFKGWLERYRSDATARGLPQDWLDKALSGLSFNPRVVELDRNQPDDSGRRNIFADYLARRLTADRIARGAAEKATWGQALARAEAAHGVPGPILLGIWGMETDYGRVTGSLDTIRALASLAFDGRREALFTRELDAAVRMVGEGKASRQQMRGSWAGAMGQPQFLPSSYLSFAVDGDGDGKADIWGSVPDTLASIGNYLKMNGWQPGLTWGLQVAVPQGFDRASVANPEKPAGCVRPLERHSRFLPASTWRRMGFQPLGAAFPADDVEMSLVEPDGPGTPAYLTTRNYRALLSYNCSNFYALSVALLGDALAGPR
ncbi:lytic murein transglycosylase [Thermaurantiacus sp.]